MGTLVASREANTQILTMGNTAARQRLKFKDFAYIAKNTNFASRGIVEDYYNDLIAKCPIGKMDLEQFKVTFRLAFPERPEEKLLLLTEKVANVDKTDGMIPLHCMGMLLYLLCIFNLFDEDGNGTISIDELLNMMAFFIEIGADSGKVDMATVMAKMFQRGDQNKDDKLTKAEFVAGMTGHPVIAKILAHKTIDSLLETF